MENLIIYGGSFDPIHNGHLRVARAASLHFNADVVFVPAKSPRWKQPEASDKDRLAMLQLALRTDGSSSFYIDRYEMKSKDEVNYTIDTVIHFSEKYKDTNLFLLIGADEANKFDQWKNADEIAKICKVIYCPRPGIEVNEANIERFNFIRLPYEESGEVSSNDVRKAKSIDIPLSVREYIEEHRLYYIAKLAGMMNEKRLKHSISVANLSYRIAQKNRILGYHRSYIAGLLHDLGKDVGQKEQFRIMQEHFHDYLDMPLWTYHQFVGSQLAKDIFGIEDEEILDAIRYHATGKAHMSPLGKIVYSADKIDPTRGWRSSKMINSCLKNYYVGFLIVLEANRDYLVDKGVFDNNSLTKACMDLYLGR